MSLHDRYGLTRVINAAGTFTPLGVSRSSKAVSAAAAAALREFFVIDELHAVASDAVARLTGAEAAAVAHCAAAGITLSVAAAMAGADADKVAALPGAEGMPTRVVLPAGHAVNYGHPIVQDVRLAGAAPVLAGTDEACSTADLEKALAHPDTACLLLVSSRLVRGNPVDLTEAVAAAHRRGVPAIIDGAAQDLRIRELLATRADLVVLSAQKYLASPTAGLVVGRKDLVAAVRAHEKGIGRAMKAAKEAIIGVLAALEDRQQLDLDAWRRTQANKVARFVEAAGRLAGIAAEAVPDPAGMPFPRARLTVDPARAGLDAAALARALRDGTPSIRVMEHEVAAGRLVLELVPLQDAEVGFVLDRLEGALAPQGRAT
ncbi:MAG: aminotransferase class V-fold PLP-dependent enzyme [Pseudomonadota bacterium]